MDIGGLVQEMTALYRRAEAQLAHKDHLLQSQRGWEAMQTGLRETAEMLRLRAEEIEPEWRDAAGALYVERLHRSEVPVRAWEQTLAAAGIGPALTALAGGIDTTFARMTELKEAFDALVAELASLAGGPLTGAAAARVARILALLRQLVAEARMVLQRLDQAFAETAQRVSGAPNGAPWDGPVASGPGASGGPGSAPPAGGGAGAADAGTPAAPGTPAAAGAPAGAGAGAPSLAGAAAPAPVTGLPPGGLPASPAAPPAAAPTVPFIPPVGLPGSRTPGTIPSPGLGRVAGARIGVPPPTGAGSIPRAGGPAGPPSPVSGGADAGAAGAGGSPAVVPPVGGALGAGAGAAAGGSGTIGKGDQRSAAHRNRPLRTVPGVPPRLRGRAGKLDASPAFLGPPARSASRSDDEAVNNAPELLDEELWQVEQPSTLPLVERRYQPG